jgi:hypothetical protein
MRLWDRLRGRRDDAIPYDMFDRVRAGKEARRAKRMESIYHLGQAKIWDGREVLRDLIAKHGKPSMGETERKALGRIFSIIMWGELAAWRVSAQLSDKLVELEPKMAATSQTHDEARHFYVMHDYLEALEQPTPPMDFWSRRVVEMTLRTPDLTKKLLGMQLTVEVIALTLFQHVRELRVEPVLADLLVYYERDEARHVGLGTQLVPELVAKMSLPAKIDLALFQLDLLASTIFSLKAMEKDLATIGVDVREILAIGFRKQMEIHKAMREDFPAWPEDPPVNRLFHGLCDLLFATSGTNVEIPLAKRMVNALKVVARTREGILEIADREQPRRSEPSPVTTTNEVGVA